MAHRIIGDTSSGCAFVRFEHKVTLDEIIGVIDLLVEDPNHRALHRRLYDLSRAEGTLSTAELRRLADHSVMRRSELTHFEQEQRRSAILVGRDLVFGLGRMLGVFGANPQGSGYTDMRPFRTHAEAAVFLGLPAPDYDPFERDADGSPPGLEADEGTS